MRISKEELLAALLAGPYSHFKTVGADDWRDPKEKNAGFSLSLKGFHQENVHRFGRPVGGKELHDLAAESSDTFFDVFTGQRIVVHDGHPFPLQRLVKECPRAVFEHGQIGPKHGALTFDTLDQEPASHDAKQFAHNGKPQSVAAAAILRASLAKRLGDGIEFVAGDADSRVLDGQPHSESVAVLVESA